MNWFQGVLGQSADQGWVVEPNGLVVDVRSPMEFASGHVKGATNLPLDQFVDGYAKLMPNKQQQIVLYCRSGNRSGQATQFLQQNGYTNVINGINTEVVSGHLARKAA
jgi:phage shock protein E